VCGVCVCGVCGVCVCVQKGVQEGFDSHMSLSLNFFPTIKFWGGIL